jgi:hypothetical protein
MAKSIHDLRWASMNEFGSEVDRKFPSDIVHRENSPAEAISSFENYYRKAGFGELGGGH